MIGRRAKDAVVRDFNHLRHPMEIERLKTHRFNKLAFNRDVLRPIGQRIAEGVEDTIHRPRLSLTAKVN